METCKPNNFYFRINSNFSISGTFLVFIFLFLMTSSAEAQFFKKLKEAAEKLIEVPENSDSNTSTNINRGRPCMPATPAGQEIIFSDDFESGSFAGKMWAARTNENGFVKVVDRLPDMMDIPYSGDYALAIGIEKETNVETINAADLCLNLSGQQDALLRFYIRDQSDEDSEEDAILLSDDGGKGFEQALRLLPSGWEDDTYGNISFDIAAAAKQLGLSLTDQMVIRFQQKGKGRFNGSYTFSRDGYFIDNVIVLGAPTYIRPPFLEGFESDELGNMWRVADPFRKGETALELEAQWGFVAPVQRIKDVPSIPHAGDYALAMGIPKTGKYTVNALDLHLDLSAKDEAALHFYIRYNGGKNYKEDGIYFSDDGGLHFSKALDFNKGSRADIEYSEVSLDIAERVSQLRLSLTNKFIIRIQQKGAHSFAPSRGFATSGFFIDDLSVQTTLSIKEKVLARVNAKMAEWKKKGPYEKTEKYEERMKQGEATVRKSFEREALNEVAKTGIDWKSARTEYNADKEAFTVSVESLEPFILKVPVSEAEIFDENLKDIEYSNPAFEMRSDDAIRVTYLEITNPANGKKYTVKSEN